MSAIHADVEKMQSFLDHLRRFDQLLDDEFRSMIGHWRDLGGVWTDNKYHEFGRDLEEVPAGSNITWPPRTAMKITWRS